MSPGNIFAEFYWKLPMGRKDTSFGKVLPANNLGSQQAK